MRGFIKTWRVSGVDEIRMPDVQYKVWMLIQILAIHAKHHDLKAGQVRTSYSIMQEWLTRDDGSTPSATTIRTGLNNLAKHGYIKMINEPGRKTVITILRWSEMQGKHPEGHEWSRTTLS